MESEKFCKTTYMIWVKGSERIQFILIFRLNIVLLDLYQADEIVMGIKKWKQKVLDDYVESFIKVLLSVFETSIVS